ncbi:hypothetical protein EVAR_66911_1 [Eumeta japonica]|uniref:Uncharacterized protein n=1 Tax=Eumeta variegata TaxID=151549 RepID=A0A4C1Z7P4_EUMVA|nr:hypothetical protein EVAR_66911_1 [Eumeta japonica]
MNNYSKSVAQVKLEKQKKNFLSKEVSGKAVVSLCCVFVFAKFALQNTTDPSPARPSSAGLENYLSPLIEIDVSYPRGRWLPLTNHKCQTLRRTYINKLLQEKANHQSKISPTPMGTRNLRGITSPLPAFWKNIRYLMEGDRVNERGKGE